MALAIPAVDADQARAVAAEMLTGPYAEVISKVVAEILAVSDGEKVRAAASEMPTEANVEVGADAPDQLRFETFAAEMLTEAVAEASPVVADEVVAAPSAIEAIGAVQRSPEWAATHLVLPAWAIASLSLALALAVGILWRSAAHQNQTGTCAPGFGPDLGSAANSAPAPRCMARDRDDVWEEELSPEASGAPAFAHGFGPAALSPPAPRCGGDCDEVMTGGADSGLFDDEARPWSPVEAQPAPESKFAPDTLSHALARVASPFRSRRSKSADTRTGPLPLL